MRRILPTMSLTAVALAACTSATQQSKLPAILPAADPTLYRCAESVAAELGFEREDATMAGGVGFQATTNPDRLTGTYDGLSVRILSDTGRVFIWLTAVPYSVIMQRGSDARRTVPSRRAIDAASTVERRCALGALDG